MARFLLHGSQRRNGWVQLEEAVEFGLVDHIDLRNAPAWMQEAALAAQMVRPQSEGGPQIEEIVSGEEEQSELEPATPHPNSEASPVCDSETAHSTEQQPHTHPQSQPLHATSEAAERMTFMHQSVSEPGVALVSPQAVRPLSASLMRAMPAMVAS
jgi:hypothetical protein